MTFTLYDNSDINADILLDLPFREATGIVTQDVAKPHHPVSLVNTPTWATLASGLGVLQFNGTNEYCQALNADTADLDFIAGDYSLSAWINWTDTGTSSIVMGRYELDVSGWELYLTKVGVNDYLTIRHHHAGTIVDGHPRTASSSTGWAPGTWYHMGVSRIGTAVYHYRNGVSVTVTTSTGGLVSPETCTQDLVIGTRFTKDSNYYKNQMSRPRVWDEALSATDWKTIYEIEKRWYP